MKNITQLFSHVYAPVKALVVYQQMADDEEFYVESFDIGDDGKPSNASPLTDADAAALSAALQVSEKQNGNWLRPERLLPANVLHISPAPRGRAIWYTPAAKATLHFTANIGLPDGQAHVPALIWEATLSELNIFALATKERPGLDTPLYHAPFFNIYRNGSVCMGNVETGKPARSLEHFISRWQQDFWNSAFSHTIDSNDPVRGDLRELWAALIGWERVFPTKKLIKCNKTIQSLL